MNNNRRSSMKKVSKKKVNKNLLVNFVLDESGSMEVCKEATIGGFNEYIQTLQKESQNTRLTLTKFDSSKIDIVYTAEPIISVPPLNEKTYSPNSCTPLYDAIAKTIKSTDEWILGNTKQKEKFVVLCVIMTDGQENSSKEYDRNKIFDLIKKKEKRDKWTFVYLGANQDSYAVGGSLGLSMGNTLNYAHSNFGAQSAFSSLAYSTSQYSCSGYQQTTDFFSVEQQKKADSTLKI